MFGCQMEKPILAENDVIIERKQAQLSVFLVPLKLLSWARLRPFRKWTDTCAIVLSAVNNWLTSCFVDISASALKNGDKKRLDLNSKTALRYLTYRTLKT